MSAGVQNLGETVRSTRRPKRTRGEKALFYIGRTYSAIVYVVGMAVTTVWAIRWVTGCDW